MKRISVIMTYLLAMLFGTYLAKQFIYHESIEPHRWVTTFVLFLMFYVQSKKER